MHISKLSIVNIRNLAEQTLSLGNRFNLLVGPNGSGKSSLVEALYILAMGRSPRTHLFKNVITTDKENVIIHAKGIDDQEQIFSLGFSKATDGNTKIRKNEENLQSIAELARVLPIMLLDAHSFEFLYAGPKIRRQFLDFGLFHVKPNFFSVWHDYYRLLKQRNALLKQKQPYYKIKPWDNYLIEVVARFDEMRQAYVIEFVNSFQNTLAKLNLNYQLSINYYRGWPKDCDNYKLLLEENYTNDLQLGYTKFGPHRADLKFKTDNISADVFLSRGQQKIFIIALWLHQLIILFETTQKQALLMIDDIAAELDSSALKIILKLISELGIQTVLTAVDENIETLLKPYVSKTFHVEHGMITEC